MDEKDYQPISNQAGPQPTQNSQPTGYSNGTSIAALVCGILGIVGAFIPVIMYFTLALGILGIIFGVNGQKKAKTAKTTSGLATAGLVCGIVGTSFSAIGVLCTLACVGTAGGFASGLSRML